MSCLESTLIMNQIDKIAGMEVVLDCIFVKCLLAIWVLMIKFILNQRWVKDLLSPFLFLKT